MVGVVLFRAQPYHIGHEYIVKTAAAQCKEVHVFVGSANQPLSKRNPIPITIRYNLVKNSLECYENVFVHQLNDMTDEADSSLEWGFWLYRQITSIIKVTDFTFYYSDKPDIMLEWFDEETLRSRISFKFLKRINGTDNMPLTATRVRKAFMENDYNYLSTNLSEAAWKVKESIAFFIENQFKEMD